MKILTETLKLETKKEFEIIKISDKIKYFFNKSKIKNGFLNIYSKHTTLAIKINEHEELLLKDYWNFMKKIADEDGDYHHDIIEMRKNCPADEPKNAKGHLRCLILETSQIIPVINGKLQLGRYQEIFAFETSGPRKREIIVQIVGE